MVEPTSRQEWVDRYVYDEPFALWRGWRVSAEYVVVYT